MAKKKQLPTHYHDEFLKVLNQRDVKETELQALQDKIDKEVEEFKKKKGLDKLEKKAEKLRNDIDNGYDKLEEIYETVLKLLAKGYSSNFFGMEIKSEKSGRPSYKSISLDLCKKFSIPNKAYEAIKDKYMEIKEYMILVYKGDRDDLDQPNELKKLEIVEPSIAKKRKQSTSGPHRRNSDSFTGKVNV